MWELEVKRVKMPREREMDDVCVDGMKKEKKHLEWELKRMAKTCTTKGPDTEEVAMISYSMAFNNSKRCLVDHINKYTLHLD